MNLHALKLTPGDQLILFGVLLFSLILIIYLTKKIIKSYIVKNSIEPHRRKLILSLSYLIYYTLFFVLSLLIFGVSLKELLIFLSSILAVLGVAFFAQWSILSNLTASVILFFYHPVRIGDTIKIIEKDNNLEGKVKNITGLYVLLEVPETKREVTIPNTVILYKTIELIKN